MQQDDLEPRAEAIFNESQSVPIEQRREHILRACGSDAALLARTLALLSAAENAGGFLAAPTATEIDIKEPLNIEKQIGRYRILERIGEGGMGEVYVAEQTEPMKRRVAIKVIKPGLDTRQVVARFEAERQALALMDHPNIARVFDAGTTEGGRPYFVMELVRGTAITRFCDDNKLTTRRRVELLVDVCRAVQHAHQKGIIHRDIKPQNILVALHDGKPVPKVIDFGIAKATSVPLTDKTVYTEFRQMLGTPTYMSPEQAGLSDKDIDTRSDIYSLGVLLYELLTGTTPVDPTVLRAAAFDRMYQIIRESEPSKPSTKLSTLNATLAAVAGSRGTDPKGLSQLVRGELDWIAMKTLEKDRTRRYDTAAALGDDLQRYLEGEPVIAGPPSRTYRWRKFAYRYRRPLAIGVALVVLLLLGIAGTSIGLAVALAQKRQTIFAQQNAEKQRVNADEQRTIAEEQLAITHQKAAALAEAHGDWAIALTEYHQAEAGRHVDLTSVLTGELRALARESNLDEGSKLVRRVRTQHRSVYANPNFTLVRGLLFWTADPNQSRTDIQQALASSTPLTDGDRYFARGLVTDDVQEVADNMKKSLAVDLFNRDAWAILAMSNVVLGNLTEAEQESRLCGLLFPQDDGSAVIAAVAAALQGHVEIAKSYLDQDAQLPANARRLFNQLVELLAANRTLEKIEKLAAEPGSPTLWNLIGLMTGIARVDDKGMNFSTPLAFSKATSKLPYVVSLLVTHRQGASEQFIACFPGAISHFLVGVQAASDERFDEALTQMKIAATMPSMFECRRYALNGIIVAKIGAADKRHASKAEMADEIRGDLQAIWKDGGIPADLPASDDDLFAYCESPYICIEGRELVLQREALEPDNAQLLYIQARAEWTMGNRDLAMGLLERRLANGEDKPSRNLLGEIQRTPTTRPAPEEKTPIK